MLKLYRKGTYQSRSQSSQKRVCPITPSLRFPLQAGGTEPMRPTRFPSRSGGNLKEGGNCKLCPCDWYKDAISSVGAHGCAPHIHPRRVPQGRTAVRPYYPPTLTVFSGLSVPTSRSRTPRYATRKLNRFSAPRYSHTYGLAVSNANRRFLPSLPVSPISRRRARGI